MKTFRDILLSYLRDNGLSDNQSSKVFIKVYKTMDDMIGRWDDDVEGYPPIMQNLVLLSTKRVAYEWINENIPMAWFKPMFAPTEDK